VKLGDLFTNAKIPRPLRLAWPVVTHGNEIVWVPGLRRSNAAPLGPRDDATLIELDASPLCGTSMQDVLG